MNETKKTPAHVHWLQQRGERLVRELQDDWHGTLHLDFTKALTENLFKKLSSVGKQTLDVLYYGGDLGTEEEFLADGDARVASACPQLMELLQFSEKRLKAVLLETMERIETHRQEIARELLGVPGFSAIRDLRFGTGDSHNHGRTVSIVTTDAGKFVYKPHSMMIDLAMREIAQRFFSEFLYVPKTVDCGSFGFCEFVENKPETTAEGAARYYYRMGGFAAVARMLCSTDLHVENMICFNGFPTPIDGEMMLSPRFPGAEKSDEREYLRSTVLRSCLMPHRIKNHEVSFLFSQTPDNVSAPLINGRNQTLDSYLEPFLEGFRAAYRLGQTHQEELLEIIHNLHDFPVRIVIVATRIYAGILRKSRMWKWVTMPDRSTAIRNALLESITEGQRRDFMNIEADCLLEGDVPYFYARVDGTALLYLDGVAAENYFALSPRDNAEQCIRRLSEEDMELHCRLFRLSTHKVVRPNPKPVQNAPAEPLLTDVECRARAEELARSIMGELLTTPRGETICFSKVPESDGTMLLSFANLMNGVHGIGIFFAAMMKNTRDEALKNRLRIALDGIIHTMRKDLEQQITAKDDAGNNDGYGMAAGLTGYLMAANLIRKYTGNEACAELCQDIMAALEKITPKPLNPDIVDGPSAALKLLCITPELRAYPGAEHLMNKLADQLLEMRETEELTVNPRLWRTINPEQFISGAAHGQSGIGTALYIAGKLLNRRDLLEAADDALGYEAKLYSPQLRGWPDLRRIALPEESMHGYCSGAPGIGANALQRGTEDAYGLLPLAIDSCLNHKLLPLDHLCCGNSASIDFLLEAGRQMNRQDLIVKSRELLTTISRRADANGGYQFIRGDALPVDVPSLFFGNAGVGYTLLRQIDPELTTLML